MSDNQAGNQPEPNHAQPAQPPVPPAPPAGQPAAPAAPQAPAPGQPAGYGVPAPQPKGLAITALILGIVGLIFSWVPVLGLVLGIVAVILGIMALKKMQPKGLGLTGLITGGIAVILGAIWTIMFFVALSMVGDSVGGAMDAVEQCEQGATSVEIMGETIQCADILP